MEYYETCAVNMCNEFSLRESDFCTVPESKVAALWQFAHVVSWLQQVLQVRTVKIRILITYQALGWIWVFLLPALVCSVDLEQYNQTLVYFCDPASVVLSYIIHLMIRRDQLGQSYNSLCVPHSQYDTSVRWDYSSGWVLQWKTVRMVDFSLCRWVEKLQTWGLFWGAGGWIYLALTYLNISSEMKNQNVF